MQARPVVVFDALGTLFDLSALDPHFLRLGGSSLVRELWFERLLDTSKALTLAGAFEPFDTIALTALRARRSRHTIARPATLPACL